MPGKFTASFAQRMNECCQLEVTEFNREIEKLEPGCVYIANGDYHMRIANPKDQLKALRDDGELVNRHKPSVDVLFSSIGRVASDNVVGVLLTGMGSDGAQGLLEMHQAGAITIAQDEKSSVVWGMPKSAVEIGAASEVLALNEISSQLIAYSCE